MLSYLKTFIDDNDGATAIEYGLLAGLIAVAIIVAITALGTDLSQTFTNIAGRIPTAAS